MGNKKTGKRRKAGSSLTKSKKANSALKAVRERAAAAKQAAALSATNAAVPSAPGPAPPAALLLVGARPPAPDARPLRGSVRLR